MAWIKSEKEVDKIIKELKAKNKKYITQGVSFDKNSESHMRLLKMCLMHSSSFSGLIKELIATRFNDEPVIRQVENPVVNTTPIPTSTTTVPIIEDESFPTFKQIETIRNDLKLDTPKKANTSNFL